MDEVGGRTRKWVGAGAGARGSELAVPSRRGAGARGFPVMGLWGARPDSLGGKGHGRARRRRPGPGQAAGLAVVARADPAPGAPPRAAVLCPVAFGRSAAAELCRARLGKAC